MFSGQVILEFFIIKKGSKLCRSVYLDPNDKKKTKKLRKKKEERATSGSVLKTFKALGALKKIV